MLDSLDTAWRPLVARQVIDNATGVLYMADPPPGHIRHTVDRPNLHKELTATAVSMTVLACVAVALRVFTRVHVTKAGLGVDDYMVVIALAFAIGLLGMNFKHMAVGLGYHFWDIPMTDYMVPFQVMTLAGTMVYSLSLAFSKMSILFLYLRLSPQRWFRILVWTLLGVVVTYAVIYNLISLFGCHPVAATWDLSQLPNAKCLDQLTKYMALSILNIIIDVFELILPIPVVVPLQMSIRQKISILMVFATGAFVCAVAIKRTLLLPSLMVSTDYTWAAVEQFQWCFVEVDAGVITASIPALKPFFVRYLPSLLNSRIRSDQEYTGDSAKNKSPYDTMEREDRARPRKKASLYELTVLDNASEKSPARAANSNDDEARLWTGGGKSSAGQKDVIRSHAI